MQRLLTAVLIVCLAVPVNVLAKDNYQRENTDPTVRVMAALQQMEVGQDTGLTVILRDKSVITGYLQRVGAHSFLVMTPATGSAVQVPYRNVLQIRLWSPDQKTRIIVVSAIAAALVYLVLVVKRF